MNNSVNRIRATSDSLLDDLETLRRLEEEKRNVPLNTERFHELEAKIESLGRAILAGSERQRELGERVATPSTINETAREIGLILGEWRDAERRLQVVEPGSDDAERAARDVERLRDEYREVSQRSREGSPD